MKNKLLNALTIGYEAVYLINLEDDTFEILKKQYESPAMTSSNCWSAAGAAFVEECSEHSKPVVHLLSDVRLLRAALSETDIHEFTFRHVASDAQWKKADVQVIERKGKLPTLALMTVSKLDQLAQKEKMLHMIAAQQEAFEKQATGGSAELPLTKMLASGEAEGPDGKLFDQIKILLVDDSEILRMISKEILEEEGAIVTEAEDGRQAVEAVVSGGEFDFIIMDIVMPGLDGISATKEIVEYQKDRETKTPILGLTADATDDQVKLILEAGAYACLSKPLRPMEMSKVLISYMKEKSMLMEEKMAEIKMLANTDMLTQTGNIVAYTQDISELSRTLSAQESKIAIVVCDLDNLKGINDTYGHDVGDVYIKNCCGLISEVFHGSPLYRVGGDEFALLVKDADFAALDALTLELNNLSRKRTAIEEVVDGKASVSSGYAIYDAAIDQSLSDTMKRADIAMYENKLLHKRWTETYPRLR